jgi:hypothetical protein
VWTGHRLELVPKLWCGLDVGIDQTLVQTKLRYEPRLSLYFGWGSLSFGPVRGDDRILVRTRFWYESKFGLSKSVVPLPAETRCDMDRISAFLREEIKICEMAIRS